MGVFAKNKKYVNVTVISKFNPSLPFPLNSGRYHIDGSQLREVTLFRLGVEGLRDYLRIKKTMGELSGSDVDLGIWEEFILSKEPLNFIGLYSFEKGRQLIVDKRKFERLVSEFESGKISRKLYNNLKKNLKGRTWFDVYVGEGNG